MNWREFPFLKILPAFLLGILAAARVFPEKVPPEFLLFLSVSAGAAAWVMGSGVYVWRNPWSFFIPLMLAFFMLGSWRYRCASSLPDAPEFEKLAGKSTCMLVLAEEVRKGEKGYTVAAYARAIVDTNGRAVPLHGKIMLFLNRGTMGRPVSGNLIKVSGRLERIRDNPNPGAFNYAAFLRGKRIGYSLYAGQGDWKVLRERGATFFKSMLFAMRRNCLQQLSAALPGSAEYAIGAALLIGNREDMDPGVRDIFSRTGAMHILAVSGLHVGMVAWFLGWLLRWVPSWGMWARGIVEVLGIWGYALLCGLGASVVRAALMFSWLNLGKALGRPANIWNTLGGTAFLLLLVEPLWIFDIGFQLTFLAVGGILLFEPPLYRMIFFRNRLMDYFWKLTTVGIAAQLATAPLCIYYFHQFPLFFWLSGWLAVPLGALCQATGAFFLVLGEVPILGDLLGRLLLLLIKGLYWGIYWIDKIPGGCIQGLWISEWGAWCICLLLGMGAWIYFVSGKKVVWVWVGLLFLAGLLELNRDYQALRRAEVVCFGIKGSSAVEFWQGRTVFGYYSGLEGRIEGQTAVFHQRQQVREQVRFSVFDSTVQERGGLVQWGPLVVFGGRRFYIWDGRVKTYGLPPPRADYWILCNNPFLPSEIPNVHLPREGVIADGSNAEKRIHFYKRYFTKKKVPIHIPMESGAWQQTLNLEQDERQKNNFSIFFPR